MMIAIAARSSGPSAGMTAPLKGPALSKFVARLGNGWRIVDGHHLEKEFKFNNFREAMAFTNRVGKLAELQGHHPDIYVAWGKVRLTIWTHRINGLSQNDFVLAGKVDRL